MCNRFHPQTSSGGSVNTQIYTKEGFLVFLLGSFCFVFLFVSFFIYFIFCLFVLLRVRSCWFTRYCQGRGRKKEKRWLGMYLILSPRVPALFMMSLTMTRTAGHKRGRTFRFLAPSLTVCVSRVWNFQTLTRTKQDGKSSEKLLWVSYTANFKGILEERVWQQAATCCSCCRMPQNSFFCTPSQSSGPPKNNADTCFYHSSSPFPCNFCKCSSSGICTASLF